MKVLQVLQDFPPYNYAGVETYTYNLCRELSGRHKVSVFHRLNNPRQKEYAINLRQDNGLEVYSINNTFRQCYSFDNLYLNEDIADGFDAALEKIRPDIVHIQHLIFLSASIVERVKKRGIPIVCTLHDYWFICPQWHFLKTGLRLCNKKDTLECIECLNGQLNIEKGARQVYSLLKKILPHRLLNMLKNQYFGWQRVKRDSSWYKEKIEARERYMRKICAMIDVFTAPSQYIMNRYLEFGILPDKIKLMRYFVPASLFEGAKKKHSGKIVFGFIGTILPAKGVDVLINAFKMIKSSNAELRIYGKMQSYHGFEYYPSLLKGISKGQRIRFMGGFNHNRISEILSEIDVLIVPSIWRENSPLVIHEAILSKTPVIASDIGGIPELIKDGANGFLFRINDSRDLCAKMKLFLEGPALAEPMAQEISHIGHTEKDTQELESVYHHLLLK